MFSSKFIREGFQRSLRLLLFAMICAAVFMQLAFPNRPNAAMFNTITVNSLADDNIVNGNCTLREAIQAANSNSTVDACAAGAAGLDVIEFNAGSGVPSIAVMSPLPIITSQIIINGNTGGATRIELNGTGAGANTSGLTIVDTMGCTIQSLVINRFGLNGIVIDSANSNTVKDCIIGLNPAANTDQGNGGHGITINSGSVNVIGGLLTGDRNIISGNALSGVDINNQRSPPINNAIRNNIIGTNSAGATGLGNSQDGIALNGAALTTIGGTIQERNLISGNSANGISVSLSSGTIIRNNIIGANAAGTSAIPNRTGIRLDSATGTEIGGQILVIRNLASAPEQNLSSEGNLISGNTAEGILLAMVSTNNLIQGNLIGTQLDGISALGNGSHGISCPFDLSANNTIGGTGGLANKIAFNGGAGISLAAGGDGNRITQNSIFSNSALGIDMGTAGITPNDPLDTDTGPNALQNFPVITSVTATTISATLNTLASADYRVEFFASAACDQSGNGEGEVFLGAANPSTDAQGNATFSTTYTPINGKPVITAVAINPATGDSSEFSACFISSVGATTDLSVSNTTSATAIAGANATFNLLVTNTTATPATNVVLSESIPANTTFQSLTSPAGWNCTTPAVNGTGAITCTATTMAANSTANFALAVRLNSNLPCDTTISSTATVQHSVTPDPTPNNNTSTASLISQAQSDLSVTVVAPATVTPDVSDNYVVTVTNLGPSASVQTMLNDSLPAAFSVEAINTSAGSCTGIGTNSVNCNLGTLAAGASARITIQVHIPETCQPTTAVNTATAITGNCLADPVAANNTRTNSSFVQIGNLGPGNCIPSSQPPSAQKPGSILLGGLFASAATGGAGGDPQNNTSVSFTNTHPRLGVVIHMFFVDGATCSIADAFLCLTPNQTTRFLMSDLDPGVVGYMMAMAVDGPTGTAGGNNTGCPISFNYLIGSARIKMTNSPMREAELASESCASEFGSPLPSCDPSKPFAEIPFDGSPRGFNKLPLVLAVDSIASRADGNDTMLMLARVDGNWMTGLRPLGNIFGLLYDDAEHAYSFSFNVGTCLMRSIISNNFPRTVPRFEQVVPAGRSGWMRLWSADGAAILGAVINRNDNVASSANAFNGGHNLHVLRLNERVVITVPVFPPSC